MIKLEICIDNYQSILTAEKARADRLELCSSLIADGLTPSTSIVKFAKDNFSGSLQTMIRSRPGDFYYDKIDQQIMLDEANTMISIGINGIVIGALTHDNHVDKDFLAPFVKLAKTNNIEITYHRAIDLTKDIYIATQEIIDMGFDRILTSGQGKNVIEGLNTITNLQQKFGDKIQIMPGSGVNSTNVEKIIKVTKVNDIHCSASKKILRDIDSTVFPNSALEITISQIDEIATIKSKLETI